MKIFVVGDHKTGTGPANATASLLKTMPEDTLYLKSTNKAARLFEIITGVPSCDLVFLSGHSKQNLWAIKLARIFKKPVFFWMHGCVEYENEINEEPDEDMARVERQVLEQSDRILAVSPSFEAWLKDRYPSYKGKIGCLQNGIDTSFFDEGKREGQNEARDGEPVRILCVGGGMKRKQIAKVCEAVDMLNEDGITCTLDIIGAKGADSALIENSAHSSYRGLVSPKEAGELMRQSDLFVQNSCFETFGLAPLEALTAGCDVLFSRQTGALCVFDEGSLTDTDLIEDTEDARHIADRMLYVIKEHNHDRLIAGIDMKRNSWENTVKRLFEMAGKEI